MEQPLISLQTWLPLSQDHGVEPSCVCMYFNHGASMSLGQVGTTEAGIQRQRELPLPSSLSPTF